jgi:hypothetical protein
MPVSIMGARSLSPEGRRILSAAFLLRGINRAHSELKLVQFLASCNSLSGELKISHFSLVRMWFMVRLVQTRLVGADILVWSTDGRLLIDVRLIEITSIDCARLL